MNKIKSVIFDFDYTLADSSRGVIECIAHAFINLKLPIPSSENIRKTIGMSLPNIFDTLAGKLSEPPYDEFNRFFVEQADKVMLDRIVLFAQVKPAIEQLLERNLVLGIVSTKFRYRIQAFLERENIDDAFSIIIGGEDTAKHKPDPTGLMMALKYLGCVPEEVIYVGDSTTDAETARRAAVLFVAVLTGVTTEQDFNSYSPYAVIPNLVSLSSIINC